VRGACMEGVDTQLATEGEMEELEVKERSAS
jgi:hypothetical protein